jgi:hypothetical protein
MLRHGLLMRAERGEITKQQAEAVAAAHGLEAFERRPELPRFDPKLKSHWSIVMAVAWIARRDFEVFREQDPEFCSEHIYWLYRESRGRAHKAAEPVKRTGYLLETRRAPTVGRLARMDRASRVRGNVSSVMTIREAEAALWHALAEGRLAAHGFNSRTRLRRAQLGVHWWLTSALYQTAALQNTLDTKRRAPGRVREKAVPRIDPISLVRKASGARARSMADLVPRC